MFCRDLNFFVIYMFFPPPNLHSQNFRVHKKMFFSKSGNQLFPCSTFGWHTHLAVWYIWIKPVLTCSHFWLAAIFGWYPFLAGSHFRLAVTEKVYLQQKFVNHQPKMVAKTSNWLGPQTHKPLNPPNQPNQPNPPNLRNR